MDTRNGQKIVNISMDIEDVYGNHEILNEVLFEFLEFFSESGIPCDVYVSGIRFDSLSLDTLTAFNSDKYINFGYHSNTHSFVTIPTLNDLNSISAAEEHYFDLRNNMFTDKEGGLLTFLRFTKSSLFRCPNFAWTPVYFEYVRQFGMRYTNIDINYHKPFMFMDFVISPVIEKPIEAFNSFSDLNDQIQKYEAVSVYLHPARLIYDQFWDKSIHRNVYDNYIDRIKFVKELFLQINDNYITISLSDLNHYYDQNKLAHDGVDVKLLIESMTKKWKWSQLPSNFYNQNHVDECVSAITGTR